MYPTDIKITFNADPRGFADVRECVIVVNEKEVTRERIFPARVPSTLDEITSLMPCTGDHTAGKLFKKTKYQDFNKRYGIPPTKMIKVFRGAYYHGVLEPVKPWIDRYALRKGGRSPAAIQRILMAQEHLVQAEKDGLRNIEPLIYIFGQSPAELKKRFGKSLWKKLCKNSSYRNTIVGAFLHKTSARDANMDVREYVTTLPAAKIKVFNQLFSDYRFSPEHVNFLIESGVSASRISKLSKTGRTMFIETLMLALRSGRKFDSGTFPDSRAGLVELHNELVTEERNIRSKRKEVFREFTGKCNIGGDFTSIYGKINVKPLTTSESIKAEGHEMHHCVGMYTGSVVDGSYKVFSLEKGGKRATLGISGHDHCEWKIDQMYGVCNEGIKDIDFEYTAQHIEDLLNAFGGRHV